MNAPLLSSLQGFEKQRADTPTSVHLAVADSVGVQGPALVVGDPYTCNSSRKGRFVMRVTEAGDEWVTGIVIDGKAGAMLAYNEKEIGEEVTVRRSLCHFTPFTKATGQTS